MCSLQEHIEREIRERQAEVRPDYAETWRTIGVPASWVPVKEQANPETADPQQSATHG